MSTVIDAQLCRIVNCLAIRSPTSHDGYCAVHENYQQSTGNEQCRKCQKKIRTGSFAKKAANNTLEHIGDCPKTGKERTP